MVTMENELMRLDEKLYFRYQRSVEIATLEWLPNVTPNKGSYNSLPHLRGVMGKIDNLLYSGDCAVTLNSSELYVMLCSVLLHDIGKCFASSGKCEKESGGGKKFDHAAKSQTVIVRQWAELGLVSDRVASVIAQVCRFHDCLNEEANKKLSSEYYIDQFALIRGRLLGALLLLADHLDDSMSRSVPAYLAEDADIEEVGRFRRKIIDVRPDKVNRMVRTILDGVNLGDEDLYGKKSLKGDLQEFVKRGKGNYTGPYNREQTVLYTIAADTLRNNQDIYLIKDELSIMGIPMKKWLIECDEQLFEVIPGTDGRTLDTVYALEPLINLDYCLEVLKGICLLSGGIFAQTYHKYSELVNYIREDKQKEYKVKCAVRRLSLLLLTEQDNPYSIYYDERVWRFNCAADSHPKHDGTDGKQEMYIKLSEFVRGKVVRKDG